MTIMLTAMTMTKMTKTMTMEMTVSKMMAMTKSCQPGHHAPLLPAHLPQQLLGLAHSELPDLWKLAPVGKKQIFYFWFWVHFLRSVGLIKNLGPKAAR